MPVNGDLETSMDLHPAGTVEPVNGPVANISLLSGSNGSVFTSISSNIILAAIPSPPINFLANERSRSCLEILFWDKSTLRILPT